MPDIIITPKGERYRKQLNEMFHEKRMSNPEMDDWDVLFELGSRIRRHGYTSDEDILAMVDRGQGLGSLEAGQDWHTEELRSDVRSSLRRLFEAGYISYA